MAINDNIRNNRQVASWLLIGVGMIVIQVLIGGITRLTESGLSITEWKPITGALPPLSDKDWLAEFDKYKSTDQFKYVHQSFSLQQFKFIFFWEWFHRLWARFMGVVFLAGFFYFLVKQKFNRQMIIPMVILFLLGALQGAVGWIMVKSGLVPEKYFVGHIELTTHFIAALILLAYTLWFALSLLPSMQRHVVSRNLRIFLIVIGMVLFIQLVYGGFMAGLKAAVSAPTWPDINGKMIPAELQEFKPWYLNLINNPITIQFIHRYTGYMLFLLTIAFYFSTSRFTHPVFRGVRKIILVLMLIQVVLGIASLLTATSQSFIWMAASHQLTAMLIVICLVCLFYLVRRQPAN